MSDIVHSSNDMIVGMAPDLRTGTFVFASVPPDQASPELTAKALATFHEREGLSLLVRVEDARAAGLPTQDPMHCITLNVYSSLTGVGLTAAVSAALSRENIPCNMVAAFHHDHVFVPAELGEHALKILQDLQSDAAN